MRMRENNYYTTASVNCALSLPNNVIIIIK